MNIIIFSIQNIFETMFQINLSRSDAYLKGWFGVPVAFLFAASTGELAAQEGLR